MKGRSGGVHTLRPPVLDVRHGSSCCAASPVAATGVHCSGLLCCAGTGASSAGVAALAAIGPGCVGLLETVPAGADGDGGSGGGEAHLQTSLQESSTQQSRLELRWPTAEDAPPASSCGSPAVAGPSARLQASPLPPPALAAGLPGLADL